MISYSEPAVTKLESRVFTEQEITVWVHHENENHPAVSGNKWWKLKPNVAHAVKGGDHTILTFGGAYSNHIYATAAAAKAAGLKSIGIIRGEEVGNKTLNYARACGMKLLFISREEYRRKDDIGFIQTVLERNGIAYEESSAENLRKFGVKKAGRTRSGIFVIPEGGTNELAVESCSDWAAQLANSKATYVYVPVGTGGTISGFIRGFNDHKEVIGVPVLKNDGFLEATIRELIKRPENKLENWRLLNDYHFGGYAKSSPQLDAFCDGFKQNHGFTIEPVYTGKLFWAVFDQAYKGLLHPGSHILIIHTGGLQYLP